MNRPSWELFDCPRCARPISRPGGSETWHACALYVPRTTLDDALRRLYSAPILEALDSENAIIAELIDKEQPNA